MPTIVKNILRLSLRTFLITIAIIVPVSTFKQESTVDGTTRSTESSQESIANAEFLLGNSLYQSGDFKSAILKYKMAIGMNPSVSSFYSNLGNCLRETKDYDDSILVLQKAIYLNVGYSKNWYSLGVTYQHMGRYDEAILAYNNATTLSDDFLNAHYNKGRFASSINQS
jgi:tetratricopeptide (TPR) repeat protein